MATITALDFDISSSWDGSGVRAARNDLDELQADLRRIAETRATAQVGVNIDSGDLEQVRSELNQIGQMHETATVSVHIEDAGLSEFRSELDGISRTRATATVGANVDSSGVRRLQSELEQVNRTHATANANVSVDDTSLRRISAELHAFDSERATATATVNVNDASLRATNLELDRFGRRRETAHVDVDTSGAHTHLLQLGHDSDNGTSSLLHLGEAGGGAGNALTRMGSASGGASSGLSSLSSSGAMAAGSMSNVYTVLGYVILAMVAMGPAAALASAALLGVLGGAFIGLGAIALSGTAQVKSAMSGLSSSVQSELTRAANVMKGPLVDGMNQLKSGLAQMEPAFRQAFAAAAPLIQPLVRALTNLMSAVMPGVTAALRAAMPVFSALAVGAKALGEGISTMFSGLAKGAEGAGSALKVFMTGAGQILGIVGQAFGQMAAAGSRALGGLMSGLTSLVGGAMQGFVGAVKAMDGSLGPFFASLGRMIGLVAAQLLPILGQLLNIYMTHFTALFQQLTPIIGLVGNALMKLLVALAPLIPPLTQIMVAGLRVWVTLLTALLPLITLLAQGLGIILAPVLRVAATAITFMANAIIGIIHWITSWSAITKTFSTAWNAIWNALKIATLAVWNALQIAWNATLSGLTTAWNAVSGALKIAWSAVWNAMKVAADAVWNAMKVAWNAVVQGFIIIWQTVGTALSVAWNATWNAMKVAAQAVWTALQVAWTAFINGMKLIWDTVSNALSVAWNATWNAMKVAAEAVWSAMQVAWQAFINAMKTIWDTVSAALSAAWSAVWLAMKNGAYAVWDAMKAAWQAFISAMKTIWDTVSAALSAAWSAVWLAMKNGAYAVWDALKAAWSAFINAMKSIWDTVSAALKAAWSAVWLAMKNGAYAVWDALKAAWSAACNALKNAFEAVSGPIKSAWSATWNAVKSTASTVWGGIKHVVADGVNDVIGIINGIIGAWDKIVNAVGLKKLSFGKITYHANFADGGPVSGPGNGTSDSIPARLSNGEHVWTAAEVSAAGGHGAVASMRSRVLGGKVVRGMAGAHTLGFASGGGIGNPDGGGGGDPDTPKGANAAQRAAANVPGVYLKGNEQRIGDDQFSKLPKTQQDLLKAAGVHKVGKGIGDIIGGVISGIGKGAIHSVEDIVKLGASALGFIGKAAIHGIFDPLIKPLLNGVGAGVVGDFVSKESLDIVDEMVDLLINKDEQAGAIGGKIPEGQHKAIIDAALAAAGVPPPGTLAQWEAGLNTLITRESGWNAGVVNRWDSNAAAGHPSGGLAQVIGPTFAAYHVPGTPNNLLNPISNVAAAIRYIVARYGNITRVQQANANKPPKGYARGTDNASSGIAMVGEEGPELINFGGGEQVIPNGATQDILSGGSAGQSILAGADLSGDWQAAWDDAQAIVDNATGTMQGDTATFLTSMQSSFQGASSGITDDWAKDWDSNRSAATSSWDMTATAGTTFLNGLMKTFTDDGTQISTQWAKDWEDAKVAAQASWDTTTSTSSTFVDGLKKTFTDTSTEMQSDWEKGLQGNTDQTQKYWTDTETQFTDGQNWMTSTFFPPVNDFLTKTFPQSFATGATNVATGWNGLKQEVYDPVNAIVGTVYNQGIRGVWNVIANAFGATQLDEFQMPTFATGGAVSGPGTGTSDSITARLSNGEHVWTAAEVSAAGGHGAVASLRSQALGGGPVRKMGSTAFASGGGVEIDPTQAPGNGTQGVAGTASAPSTGTPADLANLALGSIAPVANPMLDKIAQQGKDLVDGMIPGTPALESADNGMIDGMISSVEAWITANDISFVIGGANDAAAQAWADSQVGKPYVLGGDFVNGIDCSEYQSGIARAILGQTPAPWFTTFAFVGSTAPEGFEEGLEAPYMVGVTNVGVGHMAGTLNGTNYEATPPAVRSGPSARGYNDSMFSAQYGFRPSIESSVGGVTDANHLQIIDAALAAAGVPPPGDKASWEAGMNLIITNESGWNPNAINDYDINAQNGVPSQGLAQVIPPTFSAYHVAGTSSNILDPIANVAAAINYIVHTYGNINNVPGVASVNSGGGYLPYARGTKSAAPGWALVGEEGPEPINLGGGGQSIRSFKDMLGDFREAGRSEEQPRSVDNRVTFHEGAFQFNFTGGNAEECAKAVQSDEVLEKLRQAVQAGVGKKVG
jgi:SLT domain-containing protein/phage-related protein